ncbi:MAG: ABC transporter ATP-binding protein, partial [Candidatus Limnocylindria bacterium]|nr:ABC transporter ATP-binding protein [Candidatus Limnocylindria bacterium]
IAAGGGVVADGAPADVFAREGARLAELGVWVPGPAPVPRQRDRVVGQQRTVRRERMEPDQHARSFLASARGLAFRYPGSEVWALEDASLDAHAGEAVALSGPNGSGKSTLALLLAGLLRPARGEARLGDDDAWRLPARRLVSRVGTVFQDPEHQFVTGRADDELAIGPRRAGRSEAEARRIAGELLERLHLTHLAAANPFTLSGGEQRRLSVATALATSPALLVLDEPTFGQDRRTYAELVDLLAEHRDAGGGLVFATHDRELVSGLADRTIELRAGRVA